MSRLVLLVLLCLLTWYYFPDSRAMLRDAAEPIITPVMRWGARDEMARIGRNAVAQERLTGQLPSGTAWLPWLEYRYIERESRQDSWGSTYQLEVWADSIAVVSLGPDRIRGTADDFRVVTPRR